MDSAMSRRDNTARCATCRMHQTLCICALVPRLVTRTRLAVVVHHREARKPTNTGQLAARCLEHSTVTIVGERDRPGELPAIGDDVEPVVLYPDDDALPIARYTGSARPVLLIVPDGTWRQASKLRRRVPGLAALPCVSLPEAAATAYRLRAEHRTGGLATFEAIARALGILEDGAGPAIEAAMTAVFRVMVDRTLWLRGAIGDRDVTSGIPAAAGADNPRGGRSRRTSS
jgi:DTW domain-containing protein YfiP